MSGEKSSFGSIFDKLSKLVFTDEYLNSKAAAAPQTKAEPAPTAQPIATNSTVTKSATAPASQDMVSKVHSLVESINKPGVDFFELWNAAEAMGGINNTTVSNAFVALKIASGNTLTKATVLSTGEYYCTELKNALASDVQQKMQIKQQIEENKSASAKSLNAEIADLNNKIQEMQAQLKEKNHKLQNIDAEFDPKIKEIEDKINSGNSAVDIVINEMRTVINIANAAIKE
jgi:predicted phage tail protein